MSRSDRDGDRAQRFSAGTKAFEQGRLGAAEALFRSVLDGMTTRTPGHDLTTAAIKCLAGIYEARGEYSSAWPLLTKALILDRAMLGSDHPEVAHDLNNLAGVYHAVGSYAQAEALYREAWHFLRKW